MVVTPDDRNGIPTHFGPRKEFDGLDMTGGIPHFTAMAPTTGGTRAFFPKIQKRIFRTVAIFPLDIKRILIERNFFRYRSKLRIRHF